jgi:hypothetical protein
MKLMLYAAIGTAHWIDGRSCRPSPSKQQPCSARAIHHSLLRSWHQVGPQTAPLVRPRSKNRNKTEIAKRSTPAISHTRTGVGLSLSSRAVAAVALWCPVNPATFSQDMANFVATVAESSWSFGLSPVMRCVLGGCVAVVGAYATSAPLFAAVTGYARVGFAIPVAAGAGASHRSLASALIPGAPFGSRISSTL